MRGREKSLALTLGCDVRKTSEMGSESTPMGRRVGVEWLDQQRADGNGQSLCREVGTPAHSLHITLEMSIEP